MLGTDAMANAMLAANLPDKGAVFSADGLYRYLLWRTWQPAKPLCLFVGLNPSKAGAVDDDHTIRRCINFAWQWGCGGIIVVNLFALVATNPIEMMAHPEPIGVDNDETIRAQVHRCHLRVAMWGALGGHQGRDRAVYEMMPKMQCFGLTKGGFPKHPARLPKATSLEPFQLKGGGQW